MRLFVRHSDDSEIVQMLHADKSDYYPVSFSSLEIYNKVKSAYNEIKTQNLVLNAWTNPAVPAIKLTKPILFGLSYMSLLYSLRVIDTRDIWKAFPKLPSKALSYIRERTSFFYHQTNYKVALLRCLHAGYTSRDMGKVMKVFRECGLSEENYIYYFLFIEGKYYNNLVLDNPLVLNIDVLEKEIQLLSNSDQTRALCRYQARNCSPDLRRKRVFPKNGR